MKKYLIRFLLAAYVAAMLAACGKTGPLTLPDEAARQVRADQV